MSGTTYKQHQETYYQRNKTKICERTRTYYQKNKERIQKANKIYYQKNKEKCREAGRKYYIDKRKGTQCERFRRYIRKLLDEYEDEN